LTPLLFRIVATDDYDDGRDRCANEAATFYMAYSTWDGRNLYLDDIKSSNEATTHVVYQILAKIAVLLHCRRCVVVCRLLLRVAGVLIIE